MALAAAQVVDALAARLAPTTTSTVVTDRASPIDEATLPRWRLVATDEQVERAYLDGGNRHRLQLEAQGSVRAPVDLDDAMHALASAGCAALFAEPVPYELQLDVIRRQMVSEGEAAVGRITLAVTATFYVHPAAPDVLL
ncbi:MAG: hypothetical protein KF788_08865 [Piscinibacter sp.]|nr:hypothetical protein [Piscinibacter sp.]